MVCLVAAGRAEVTYAEVEPRSEEGRGNAHTHHSGDVVPCDQLRVQGARALPWPTLTHFQGIDAGAMEPSCMPDS